MGKYGNYIFWNMKLVGGIPTSLNNMSSSVGMIIPFPINMEK
jgi:hypothetical protein